MRILIVEDEKQIAQPIAKVLERRAFAVDCTYNGKNGYESALVNDYDCILLDLNLPDMDGIEIARRLRENNIATPILMLTARSRLEEIYQGFENGTDDYLTKPFDLKELLFRIEALIKRNSKNRSILLEVDDIILNPDLRTVTKNNKEVTLNNKEYGILEYLLRNKNRIVSTEELLEHVWDREIDMFTQTVRTNMKTLRQKVDLDKKIIKTIRGSGYVIKG